MYYVLKGCSSLENEITLQIRKDEIGFWDSFEALMKSYDEANAQQSFKLLRENKVYVTPTLHIGNILSNLKTTAHKDDKYLMYIDSSLVKTYEGRIKRALNATEENYKMRKNLQQKFMLLTKALQQANISMLAGSDCGAFNSYIYPGISLHDELAAMVKAGLTPLEALRTSTFNGATFLRKDSFYGTIEIQKAADLLLLDENPLEVIRNTQKIHILIYKGEVYDRNQLQQLKKVTKN
ncbi:amidohydrolase family protein [Flavobacteriaceae bacterium M23B6Z8]